MKQKKNAINIPNILTVIRILLIPLFIIFLLKGMLHFALLVFTIAAISDALDGLFARYLDQRTLLGAYLDPLADKLLLSSAFIILAVIKIVPGWLTVIVISRDVLILLGVAIFALANINIEIRPRMISKCTTVFQMLTIFLLLLNPKIPGADMIKWILYWFTAGITILSGLHYTYIGMNLIQNASNNNQKNT
ncbi:MAG: CDP-alcohol phosphatidyltransferase family protein [Thermodesulfobacteriota bacterium]|nr:CDP-alcohol phosphatidyltransferase family protein [Thermodesulfobacteriota bacterium]